MKFTIVREDFLKGLLTAGKIITQKSIIAVFQNFKFELGDYGLVITSSNGEFSIITTINYSEGDRMIIRDVIPGAILINSRMITEIIRRLNDQEITFEVLDDNVAQIYAGNSNYKLNSIRAEEYSDIDFSLSGIKIDIPSKDLVDAVSQVAFSASTKDTRPLLTAINIESDCNNLTFTATDGSRLAKTTLPISTHGVFNSNIPAKALVEVARSITTENIVEAFVSDRKIIFSLKDTLFASNLIPGDYPKTINIIPKSFNYTLEVNSQEFLNAMSRVSLFSIERENVIKLNMNESRVVVSSRSQQLGSGEETLNLFKFNGYELEMSFNYEFVSSAIRALKSEDIIISFVGEMKPFTVSTKENKSVIQLITPVRTY